MRDIRKVAEVDGADDWVNAYLKNGWVLLDIHRRGFHDAESGEAHYSTIYILGNTDLNAKEPRDPNDIPI